MRLMGPDVWASIGTGVAIIGVVVALFRDLKRDVKGDIRQLRTYVDRRFEEVDHRFEKIDQQFDEFRADVARENADAQRRISETIAREIDGVNRRIDDVRSDLRALMPRAEPERAVR